MNSRIDAYLATLQSRLGMGATFRAQILAEVRSHLEEATAHQEAMGADHDTAERRAIELFGKVQDVAARFNAVHPAEWDALRFVKGVAWGAVACWFVWTLVTYPLLAWLTLQQGHIPGNPPGLLPAAQLDLLFYATPLAFGAFWVLATSPLLWLVPFVALYVAVPFAWGRHSRTAWRAGLAYGLGVVVGFPWMLPAVVVQWVQLGARQGTVTLLVMLAIWLMVPLAVLASWLGSRVRLPKVRRPSHQIDSLHVRLPRRMHVARVLAAGGALALLGVSAWAWTATAAWGARAQPTPAQQFAIAQHALDFAIRLPAALPEGVHLTSAQLPTDGCASCYVSLSFQGAHGEQLTLDETDRIPATLPIPSPPNYDVSQVGATSVHPIWWLGEQITVEQQVNLDWTADGLYYFLGSNGGFSVDELRSIADSIPTGTSLSSE